MRALLLVALAALTAATPQAPDVTTIGPKIGEAVPEFQLTDQNVELRTLKTILGPNGAMLVFFRSADW
jgi:hypothetical protein